jgi:CBS domain-containing protein
MQVGKVMTPRAVCTRPEATLQEAALRMSELDVGSLPVCDNDRLVGMLTDRDITIRSIAQGHDPKEHRVREVMTSDIFFCFEDQDVTEVASIMREKQVRRLPVLDKDKHLAGIVSLGDLAVETHDEELVGRALEGISEPSLKGKSGVDKFESNGHGPSTNGTGPKKSWGDGSSFDPSR